MAPMKQTQARVMQDHQDQKESVIFFKQRALQGAVNAATRVDDKA
jgi:hypothetical protein